MVSDSMSRMALLLALIDYATAAVEANMGTSEFWVGALPVSREPRTITAAHKEALARGRREAIAREKRALDAQREAARKRH